MNPEARLNEVALEPIVLRGRGITPGVAEAQALVSRQTISEVVYELETAGWLKPQGRTSGKPGRSAVVYEIDGRAGLAAAIDLGGTKLNVAIGDLVGNALAESLVPTDPRGGLRPKLRTYQAVHVRQNTNVDRCYVVRRKSGNVDAVREWFEPQHDCVGKLEILSSLCFLLRTGSPISYQTDRDHLARHVK